MRRHLGDARRVLARHALADQRVHPLHVVGERRLQVVERGARRARACSWRFGSRPRRVRVSRLRAMREILRTTDPTVIAFSTALLRGEDIDCFVLDVHMSVLEGGDRHPAASADGRRPRRLPRPGHPARQRRGRPDAGMSVRADGPHPRRLPRRPRCGSGSRAPATAPPPTRCCSRPSCRRGPGERVLELGCGAGAAALCLARAGAAGSSCTGSSCSRPTPSSPGATPPTNGLALTVHEGDLRRPPAALRALGFDHVLANPPFHPPRPRPAPPTPAATPPTARARPGSPTGSTPACAGCGPGGRLVLIHRTGRLGAILAGLEGRAGADRAAADRRARGPPGRAGAGARAQGPRARR